MPDSLPALTGHDFTANARAAIAGARRQAATRNQGAVGTEQLLVAIAAEPDTRVARVFAALSLDASRIQSAVAGLGETAVPHEKAPRPEDHGGSPPLTDSAKRALTTAMDEARALGDSHVGTEHILLALCADEGGRAAHALRSLGLSHARLQEVTRGLKDVRAGDTGTTHHPAGFHVVIDDTSSQSIYEQIVARIKEGIATTALRPGDRLPTVRQLADELDVAPGTVARAYAELERTGAVITEGARGTRVANRENPSATPSDRHSMLVGLLRPVAVAAFHLGATGDEVKKALADAMRGIW